MSPIPPAISCATALVDEFISRGVSDFVLSPGSRSAPLALVLAEREAAGLLTLHVRIDERSAGFFALGLARGRAEPVGVVCTSGTAAANLLPAVVEANYSEVPLLILSADRPVELRGVGAPQTIDQVGLFGGNIRWDEDLAAPSEGSVSEVARWRAAARSALDAAQTGPIHLNLAFRPPLVGQVPVPHPVGGSEPEPEQVVVPEIGATLPALSAGRGVLVVGDLSLPPAESAHLWAQLTAISIARGWPILAEPTANPTAATNQIWHASLILGDPEFAGRHIPEFVLSVGRFGLSRESLALVKAAKVHWSVDPSGRGKRIDPALSANRQLGALPLLTDGDWAEGWLQSWLAADAATRDVVARYLPAQAPSSGAAAALLAWRSSSPDDTLLLAASWPIRYIDAFASAQSAGRVVANRGANGIDGLVSTALGLAAGQSCALDRLHSPGIDHSDENDSASVSGGSRVLALVGDIAFLHDVGALAQTSHEANLTILVLDNNGGGIFSQLEQGEPAYEQHFERVFGTPTQQDLVSVSQGFGIPVVGVYDVPQLQQALQVARNALGCNVIVMRTGSRSQEAKLMRTIRDDVRGTLTNVSG